jgi:uncharacterized protein (TIGR02678 family)
MAVNDEEVQNEIREAGSYLLEGFWVLREQQPEAYQIIYKYQQELRNYFWDKCGFRLIMQKGFAKLEKIPVIPQSWMGIQEFRQVRDYAVFCCFLAYLEEKNVDEQFLLSDLCENLLSLYPHNGEERGLNWENYEHRKSLVRVLAFTCDMGIVKEVDGVSGNFSGSSENEVLYEVPVVGRYFLRVFPKDLTKFTSIEELLAADGYDEEEQVVGKVRSQRVYRQLMLTPVYDFNDARDEDLLYLKNYRHRIRDDMEAHTYFQFELYSHGAMLTAGERQGHMTLFPDRTGIADVMLHFAALVRGQIGEKRRAISTDGSMLLTQVDFEKLVVECKQNTGSGWSKEYREMTIPRLTGVLEKELVEWSMARVDEDTGMMTLCPVLGRTVGQYPADFQQGGDKSGK